MPVLLTFRDIPAVPVDEDGRLAGPMLYITEGASIRELNSVQIRGASAAEMIVVQWGYKSLAVFEVDLRDRTQYVGRDQVVASSAEP